MIKEPKEVFSELAKMDAFNEGTLKHKTKEGQIEYSGTFEVMQGKQKVDGHYFASIVEKPKDVRLYFFPIYTHKESFPSLSEELGKMLKGKSCFHIKKLDDGLKKEIHNLLNLGLELYKKDKLI